MKVEITFQYEGPGVSAVGSPFTVDVPDHWTKEEIRAYIAFALDRVALQAFESLAAGS